MERRQFASLRKKVQDFLEADAENKLKSQQSLVNSEIKPVNLQKIWIKKNNKFWQSNRRDVFHRGGSLRMPVGLVKVPCPTADQGLEECGRAVYLVRR